MYFFYLCVNLFVPITFLKYEGVSLKQDARRQVDFERPGFTVGAGWNKITLKIPSKANIYIYMWFKTCTFWRKRFNFKAKGHSGHLDFWGTHSSEYWAFSPPLFWYAIKAIQKEFKAKCWWKIQFCMKFKLSSEDDTQIMLKGRLLVWSFYLPVMKVWEWFETNIFKNFYQIILKLRQMLKNRLF